MITKADAGLRWLDRSTPNLDEARAAIGQIVADAIARQQPMKHSGDLKKDVGKQNFAGRQRSYRESLALTRADLERHG